MKLRGVLVSGLVAMALGGASAAVDAKCTIGKMAEVPIIMNGLRPTITAKINGIDATFMVDSGAFYSSLTEASAAEFKLHPYQPPYGLQIQGIGGTAEVSVATVKTLSIFKVDVHNVEFIVGGSEPGANVAGLLGQNILRVGDVEYDLANGVIRLMRVKDCDKTMLAYWADSKPVSQMNINWATPQEPHTTGTALLNGTKIRVVFDTGAATSFVSRRAAERAGLKMDDPSVVPAGTSAGIGRRTVKTWIAPIESFRIGDEEIRNTRLRIGDFDLSFGEMLIGADFFLSHRIYVASSQHKLYFTYNGGPVFNLNKSPTPVPQPSPQADANANSDSGPDTFGDAAGGPLPELQPGAQGGAAADAKALTEQPTDAAGFSRRGVAFAARRDYAHAIADLDRACELDPNEPSYFRQRGLVHRAGGQRDLALADFDQALKLKPDDVLTLVDRAESRLASKDRPGARADLDAADQAAPKEADIRFRLGALYGRAGDLSPLITQFDLWIPVHRDDYRLPTALGYRCLARGLLAQDLDKALSDCDVAVRRRPGGADFRAERALVELRLNQLDQAISDWDAAVKAQPRNAWALYARGVTKIKKGKSSEGEADIEAAKAMQPHILETGERLGVTAP